MKLRANATFEKLRNRGVEQLVARWVHTPKVVGSSPTPATKVRKDENYIRKDERLSHKGDSFFILALNQNKGGEKQFSCTYSKNYNCRQPIQQINKKISQKQLTQQLDNQRVIKNGKPIGI